MSKIRPLGRGLQLVAEYFQRSLDYVKTETTAALKADLTYKLEKPLFAFDSTHELEKWVVGSDADIGGLSEANWGLTPENTALFWGTISTELPANATINRSGYAGIRSKQKPLTLFHRPHMDTSMFRYLAVRARGDHNQWFVNLQTESVFPSQIWQHRLYFQQPGEWETVLIPFRDFVLTSHGFVQPRQMGMNRAEVKTIGFSIMRQPGDFSLELDWIKAINTPETVGDYDVMVPLAQQPLSWLSGASAEKAAQQNQQRQNLQNNNRQHAESSKKA
ncbi:hypothetical protein HK105_208905 [Polyrhizophydium stewartii]|uniref:NADH:ubiquinone oxidoreductase intermediate-associated protein 30 domain-containing protein n=1 Tax=Polyrhizophydium stewartii TaxID=2732419 RepID=A0ABR4MWN7_9FUNG